MIELNLDFRQMEKMLETDLMMIMMRVYIAHVESDMLWLLMTEQLIFVLLMIYFTVENVYQLRGRSLND